MSFVGLESDFIVERLGAATVLAAILIGLPSADPRLRVAVEGHGKAALLCFWAGHGE